MNIPQYFVWLVFMITGGQKDAIEGFSAPGPCQAAVTELTACENSAVSFRCERFAIVKGEAR